MRPITWFARVEGPDAWKRILCRGSDEHHEVSCTPVPRKQMFASAKREATRNNRPLTIETTYAEDREVETFWVDP